MSKNKKPTSAKVTITLEDNGADGMTFAIESEPGFPNGENVKPRDYTCAQSWGLHLMQYLVQAQKQHGATES
jgi:hypothetical protein